MENNLIIKGVECRLNENGIVELNLEHVARGLGFTQRQNKNGVVYESIRWERIKSHLQEFNFPPQVGENKLPDFVPENIFYKLCFKAENETAKKFQNLVTDEVLPSIRKHGAYMTNEAIEKTLLSPDFIIRLAQNLKDEQEKRIALEQEIGKKEEIIELQHETITELAPKASYTDQVLNSKNAMTITQIAKDYGLSAKALNKKLHDLGIQYKVNDQWVLYQKYQDKDYTKSNTYIETVDGVTKTYISTTWTQKGRLFIDSFLRAKTTV